MAQPLRTVKSQSVLRLSTTRRDAIFAAGLLCVAAFLLLRFSQFRGSQSHRPASGLISLTTTQTLLHGRVGREDEPTSIVTQLVFDSSDQGEIQSRQAKGRRDEKVAKLRGTDTSHTGSDAASSVAYSSDNSLATSSRTGKSSLTDRTANRDATHARASRYMINGAIHTDAQKAAALAYEKRQEAALQRALPREFDWQTYLLYHPDLRAGGISTETLAKQHYVKEGRAEGRVYKRLRVILRYTACTGLINQQYSHIAAFALGAVLGAEVVLPPAAKRDSFGHYFSVFKEQNEVSWTPAPLDSIMDVDKILATWRAKGLTVHKTPGLIPFPDLTMPEIAYPLYQQDEIDTRFVARMEGIYLKNLDMPELIEKARSHVMDLASQRLREDHDLDLSYIVLDLPCTFFMLRSLSNLGVVTEVAKSLEFAPAMHALAARVISGMAATAPEYNAVHLRIEKDARDWSQIMGGPEAVWSAYVSSMQQAGFSDALPMYAASGLLTYGASQDMDNIINMLKSAGLCSQVLYKELFIPKEELDALNSEQKALLDFLVLAKGARFVGFGSSTFSFYLREYRVMIGSTRSSSVLVDASAIGTDPLFNSAGTVV